jgi:hypothetical protein
LRDGEVLGPRHVSLDLGKLHTDVQGFCHVVIVAD